MKKIMKVCAALLITLIATFSFAGCGNMQVIDTTYTYHTAIIEMPSGEVKEVEVESWRDYEDGDQLQIKGKDGITYLVHSSRCVLMT